MKNGNIILSEDFSNGMDNWWVEGGERVAVEDGKLRVVSNPPGKNAPGYVCTVWCKTPIQGDVKVEFDAHVIASETDANNINFFLHYADPSGKPLYGTRDSRADGAYKKYHNLDGYIFTYLNDFNKSGGAAPDGGTKGRFRMRRCPGFNLIAEAYDYHCRVGRTYHVTITKRGGHLTYAVDGNIYMEATDPAPLDGGLLGLRTFRTDLWWDNIRVTQIR